MNAISPRQTAICNGGFTLIEMSIVLVVIGLVIGGVLVGQDLIRAAYVRAQISQIEKFNTAVNTFYGKYQALPGDMNASVAAANGFYPRGFHQSVFDGTGDGNGSIEGSTNIEVSGNNCGGCIGSGEILMFWDDLSYAHGQNIGLIEGSFSAVETEDYWMVASTASPVNYMPVAKLGNGNYVYVWSQNGINYFGISAIYYFISGLYQCNANAAISVIQSYNIDKKIDDGFPQSGRVTAQGINWGNSVIWAIGGSVTYGNGEGASPGGTASASAITCYDNGGNAGATMQYSTGYQGGNSGSCWLSFQFQ